MTTEGAWPVRVQCFHRGQSDEPPTTIRTRWAMWAGPAGREYVTLTRAGDRSQEEITPADAGYTGHFVSDGARVDSPMVAGAYGVSELKCDECGNAERLKDAEIETALLYVATRGGTDRNVVALGTIKRMLALFD